MNEGTLSHAIHLKNAPITEAIFDVRVKARKDIEADAFREVLPAFSHEFPSIEERRGFQVVFRVGDEGRHQETQDLGLQSVLLKSSDEKTLLQLRVDGFSMHRLKPYTNWQALVPRLLESWGIYARFAKPESVVRCGVRYLNHITLPADLTDFDEYLRSGPQLPVGVPPLVSGFLTQVVVHHPDWQVDAAVRQSLEQDFGTGFSTVVLDIDAYDSRAKEPTADLAETFDMLHEYKNLLFFGSLTQKALELFK